MAKKEDFDSVVNLLDIIDNGIQISNKLKDEQFISLSFSCIKQTNEGSNRTPVLLQDINVKIKIDSFEKCCSLYNILGQRNFISAQFNNIPNEIIKNFLVNGLCVYHGKLKHHYYYFGQSASHLRQKKCILYNKDVLGDHSELVSQFGEFSKMKNIAKRATRIGLLLSSYEKIMELQPENLECVPDIENSNFNFTDGCGFISSNLLEEIANKKNTSNMYSHYGAYVGPSVIQIRLNGCKGVLGAHTKSNGKVIIRPSMKKFEWTRKPPYIFGIVEDGISKPYTYAYLNKQFICILSANGIPDEVFLKKQAKFFHEMDKINENMEYALRYLYFWNRYDLAERMMQSKTLDAETRTFLSSKRRSFIVKQLKDNNDEDSKSKQSGVEGLKIPIEKSRNVFGIADPSDKLEAETCFFQPTIDGKTKIFHNTKIIVMKSPCYHPGDIKVLLCVDEPECRHMYDCIVFPTKGKRPHADEIAGSDLDGDKYFICWDDDLIPLSTHNPTSYIGAKSKETKVTYEKLIDYFSYYNTYIVGSINNLWCKWADYGGVNSKECLLLANIFSRAVDTAKSGESLKVPSELKNVPQKTDGKRFVWEQMILNAQNFMQNIANDIEFFNNLTDEELLSLVKNQQLRIDDYRLFRCLYQYLFEQTDKRELFYKLIDYICFDYFTKSQLNMVQIDCPDIEIDYLTNSLYRSHILPKDFAKYVYDNEHLNWSLYYNATMNEEINWHILNDFMQQNCNKLLVFQFNMGNMKRIIAISVGYAIRQSEYIDHNPRYNARVYMCIGNGTKKYQTTISEDFTWSMEGNRLQIFIGQKARTFICLMQDQKSDDNRNVMSVAMEFFNRSLLNEYPRLRRDMILRAEFYSDLGVVQPFYNAGSSTSLVDTNNNDSNSEKNDGYDLKDENFPKLNDAAAIEKNSKTKRMDFLELRKSVLEFMKENDIESKRNEIKQKLEDCLKMMDKRSFLSYEIMNFIIYVLSRGYELCGIDSYQKVIDELIYMAPSSKSSYDHAIDKFLTLFDNMKRFQIYLQLDQVQQILNNILFSKTCRGEFAIRLLSLFKIGILPIDINMSKENISYFSYWSSLLACELLNEIEDSETKSKQLFNIAKADIFKTQEKFGSQYVWKVNIRDSTLIFSSTDTMAFTPYSNEETEYNPCVYCQIIKPMGQIYSAVPIWPVDYEVDSHQMWRVDVFPGLVTFKRQIDALKIHCLRSNENKLDDFIITSFYQRMTGCESDNQSTFQNEIILTDKPVEFHYLKLGNEEQKIGVKSCMENIVTLIHGPPGTGKTEVACEIIAQWSSNSKVLVCAETNEAVNNIMIKLLSKGFNKYKILRVGFRDKQIPELNEFNLESKYVDEYKTKDTSEFNMDKAKVRKIVNESAVVFSTCSSTMLSYIEGITFEYLILDEATQAFEPTVMLPLTHGCTRMCLIGDHKQLPPLVKNQYIKNELGYTLFERLSEIVKPIMLKIQYRMNPIISAFPSQQFYENKLENGLNTLNDRVGIPSFPWPDIKRPIIFIDIIECYEHKVYSSKANQAEADLVKHIIKMVKSNNVKINDSDIGIITAYKAQVDLLKQLVGNTISINTVDGFQGQERELIVFSAVRANRYNDVGFLSDERRFNVTMTRAKRGLIVIGNSMTLKNDSMWKKWIEWMNRNGFIFKLNKGWNEILSYNYVIKQNK